MGGQPPIFFIKERMINMFEKLFKKKKETEDAGKIKCRVYTVKSGIYLGKVELTHEEYKYRVTFDKHNRYVKIKDEE